MYTPSFNSVLVEIDTEDDKWGRGNDDSILGKSYGKGKIVSYGNLVADDKYDSSTLEELIDVLPKEGMSIMWNLGTEAGTEFEHDGKQYAFIYWYDIRGVRE